MTVPSPPPTSVAGSVLSAGNAIGRYFNVTSAVPALLLILWSYALIASGAAGGRPKLDRLPLAFDPTIGRAFLLVLAVVFVGLFLHPLQFGTVRLLEGYWGYGNLGATLAARRVERHRQHQRALRQRKAEASERMLRAVAVTISDLSPTPPDEPEARKEWERRVRSVVDRRLRTERGDQLVRDAIIEQEALRRYADYPQAERILPTRLGNALRLSEDTAGVPYGLDLVSIAPHLMLAGDPRDVARADDAGQAMDVAVRLVLVSILATAEAVALLVTDGPWLLVALVPYTLAYVSYRGAIAGARNYGAAMAALVALNRFALYDRLQVPRPPDLAAEVQQNTQVMRMLTSRPATVRHRFPARGGASAEH